jgi:protease IV
MDTTSPSSFDAAPAPPPLPLPPPPVIMPTRTSPPRKSRGWMIFAIILLLLLGVSVLFNIGHFVDRIVHLDGMRARTAGPRLDEVVMEDNGASSKIAVVDVDGIITSQLERGGVNLVDLIKAQLKRAEEDDRVKAVILKVDSPGGEVLAADEIYRAIKAFQKKSSKPVVASMGSLAASGGYYVSAPCQWIVANELTITGSIGVIMHGWNYRGLMDKVGLAPMTYKSGLYKDMLSGERATNEVPAEERVMVQALIDETFQRFKDIVAEGRGSKLKSDWKDYADGRVLSGTDASKLGFVDELGNFDVAVKSAKKMAGISQANVVRYQQRVDLADLLGLFGKSDARAVKLDLGVEMPKLQAGQLYFLSPTYLR